MSYTAGDPIRGAALFKTRCANCHTVENGGGNKVGPNLYGIFGRVAGQAGGYFYSSANANKGIIWDENSLSEYLEDPQKYMPGTKKAFRGLKNNKDRNDLIAYLKDERAISTFFEIIC